MKKVFLAALVIMLFAGTLPSTYLLAEDSGSRSLTVEDVIKLKKAGLGDDVIIQQVKQQNHPFQLSTDDLIALKAASLGDGVIQVMLDPSKSPAAPATDASVVPNSGPAMDVGVYMKKKEKWEEVLPEVVNTKTGGVLKGIASYGIVKGDLNGHIQGESSNNVCTFPVEIMVVVPEGVAITEYQLLRLHQHGKNREFRMMTGGVVHSTGGATRDSVPFEGKKTASRTYMVTLSAELGKGEYGFLPPGAVGSASAASVGKIYSLKIIE